MIIRYIISSLKIVSLNRGFGAKSRICIHHFEKINFENFSRVWSSLESLLDNIYDTIYRGSTHGTCRIIVCYMFIVYFNVLVR